MLAVRALDTDLTHDNVATVRLSVPRSGNVASCCSEGFDALFAHKAVKG